jgi:hypothetical protein
LTWDSPYYWICFAGERWNLNPAGDQNDRAQMVWLRLPPLVSMSTAHSLLWIGFAALNLKTSNPEIQVPVPLRTYCNAQNAKTEPEG